MFRHHHPRKDGDIQLTLLQLLFLNRQHLVQLVVADAEDHGMYTILNLDYCHLLIQPTDFLLITRLHIQHIVAELGKQATYTY